MASINDMDSAKWFGTGLPKLHARVCNDLWPQQYLSLQPRQIVLPEGASESAKRFANGLPEVHSPKVFEMISKILSRSTGNEVVSSEARRGIDFWLQQDQEFAFPFHCDMEMRTRRIVLSEGASESAKRFANGLPEVHSPKVFEMISKILSKSTGNEVVSAEARWCIDFWLRQDQEFVATKQRRSATRFATELPFATNETNVNCSPAFSFAQHRSTMLLQPQDPFSSPNMLHLAFAQHRSSMLLHPQDRFSHLPNPMRHAGCYHLTPAFGVNPNMPPSASLRSANNIPVERRPNSDFLTTLAVQGKSVPDLNKQRKSVCDLYNDPAENGCDEERTAAPLDQDVPTQISLTNIPIESWHRSKLHFDPALAVGQVDSVRDLNKQRKSVWSERGCDKVCRATQLDHDAKSFNGTDTGVSLQQTYVPTQTEPPQEIPKNGDHKRNLHKRNLPSALRPTRKPQTPKVEVQKASPQEIRKKRDHKRTLEASLQPMPRTSPKEEVQKEPPDVIPKKRDQKQFLQASRRTKRKNQKSPEITVPKKRAKTDGSPESYAVEFCGVCLEKETCEDIEAVALEYLNRCIHTVNSKNLSDRLEKGFEEFRIRNHSRYELIPPDEEFQKMVRRWERFQIGHCDGADPLPWMASVQSILKTEDVFLVHRGFFCNAPGSSNQDWHHDLKPPEWGNVPMMANVFVNVGPDITMEMGPTEFKDAEIPLLPTGGSLVYDYRAIHRGKANQSKTTRILLYLTYAAAIRRSSTGEMKPACTDTCNFVNTGRLDPLPLPPSREQRYKNRVALKMQVHPSGKKNTKLPLKPSERHSSCSNGDFRPIASFPSPRFGDRKVLDDIARSIHQWEFWGRFPWGGKRCTEKIDAPFTTGFNGKSFDRLQDAFDTKKPSRSRYVNDEIINLYSLFMTRNDGSNSKYLPLSTYVYPMLKYRNKNQSTKEAFHNVFSYGKQRKNGSDIDLRKYEVIDIPIFSKEHWSRAFVFNLCQSKDQKPCILFMDSSEGYHNMETVGENIRSLLNIMHSELNVFCYTKDNLPIRRVQVPQQEDPVTCGYYAMYNSFWIHDQVINQNFTVNDDFNVLDYPTKRIKNLRDGMTTLVKKLSSLEHANVEPPKPRDIEPRTEASPESISKIIQILGKATTHLMHIPESSSYAELTKGSMESVFNMLRKNQAGPSQTDTVIDLGVGAGTFLAMLCLRFGCRGIGVEYSPLRVKMAADGFIRLFNDWGDHSPPNTVIIGKNILDIRILPRAKIVYMFDEAFTDGLMRWIGGLVGKAKIDFVLATKAASKPNMTNFWKSFGYEEKDKLSVTKSGSGSGNTMTLYKFVGATALPSCNEEVRHAELATWGPAPPFFEENNVEEVANIYFGYSREERMNYYKSLSSRIDAFLNERKNLRKARARPMTQETRIVPKGTQDVSTRGNCDGPTCWEWCRSRQCVTCDAFFQHRESLIQVKRAIWLPGQRHGIFATGPIKSDTMLIEYTGKKHKTPPVPDGFALKINDAFVVPDGEGKHRYVNHVCRNANARFQQWTASDGTDRVSIVATRNISCGEEVVVSYNYKKGKFHCHCPSCSDRNVLLLGLFSTKKTLGQNRAGYLTRQAILEKLDTGELTAQDGRDMHRASFVSDRLHAKVFTVANNNKGDWDRHIDADYNTIAFRNAVLRKRTNFVHVELDYVWNPLAWQRDRIKTGFIQHAIVGLSGCIPEGGRVILPFSPHMVMLVLENQDLKTLYEITVIYDGNDEMEEAMLYQASEIADEAAWTLFGKDRNTQKSYISFTKKGFEEHLKAYDYRTTTATRDWVKEHRDKLDQIRFIKLIRTGHCPKVCKKTEFKTEIELSRWGGSTRSPARKRHTRRSLH